MTTKESVVTIEQMQVGVAAVNIVGTSPMIFNAMSAKARHELLLPRGRKSVAEKAQTLKHDPLSEYVNSCYRRIGDGETRIIFPAAAFKSAMCNAALEVQGAKKAQIGRLVWVEGDYVDVYGVPKLMMSVVRSADMNKTPDIRTRAIIRDWACTIRVRHVMPTLSYIAVARLLETAGMVIGVGDFRQEKGKGNYGQFRVADASEIAAIKKGGGIKQQDAAFKTPECYDSESAELLAWFNTERAARGK